MMIPASPGSRRLSVERLITDALLREEAYALALVLEGPRWHGKILPFIFFAIVFSEGKNLRAGSGGLGTVTPRRGQNVRIGKHRGRVRGAVFGSVGSRRLSVERQ